MSPDLDALLDRLERFALAQQAGLCAALERLDGAGAFGLDRWERPGGGGGVARVLQNEAPEGARPHGTPQGAQPDGALLEKAGVNVSRVHGEVAPELASRLTGEGTRFEAVGLSLVLHPQSPFVPTVHLNVRMVRRGSSAWIGGGADLTPSYLFEEDCTGFHRVLRQVCERHEPGSYARHKAAADQYFYLPHRQEHRGVGGIFFDHLTDDLPRRLELAEDLVRSFLDAWGPIAARRRSHPYGEAERRWQEIRRGRYVEFNLVHDRGTVFGLVTGGRIESVLMSLPPRVRWVYDHRPAPGSPEAGLLEVLRTPREWAPREA
jgi:coproporphyrinogen III oxidase